MQIKVEGINKMNGYVKLFKNIKNWKWYKNVNTFKVFIHCLLSAYYDDFEFEDTVIKRGSFVTGREQLSIECGLTQQQVRTALNHLKSTNEITIKTTNRGTIITVVNYEQYQQRVEETTDEVTNEVTNNQPTNNQQVTTNKNIKNNNKYKKENIKRKKYFENVEVNNAFLEYLELRIKLKVVNTERVINRLINKIRDLDDQTKLEVIETSITKSYKDFYPPTRRNGQGSSSSYYGSL